MIRCQGTKSGQCQAKKYWGVEGAKWDDGSDASCYDGSDLYRPIIKKPTKTEKPGRQPSKEDEHTSDGEQRNNEDDGNLAKEKPTTQINKRDSAKTHSGKQSKAQMWKTRPAQWRFEYEGKEELARKDSSTGLWMIPESNPFKVPSVTEEHFEKGPKLHGRREEGWADFYSSNDYVKDEATNRMMASPTEETCKASDGFVCKVRLGVALE